MQFYEHLAFKSPEWLSGQGKEIDIIMCSRIRLARNLQGFIFPGRANEEENEKSLKYIVNSLQKLKTFQNYFYLSPENLQEEDLYFLFERHLISKEHLNSIKPRGVFLKKDGRVSIMINEEDHLRIQLLHSGLYLKELWEEMDLLDDILEENLPYAFHQKYGYLTACPTNTGTGMRVSVMLHLPALNFTKQMGKIQNELSKHHFVLRGFYGEGSIPLGDFFQLSNQRSMGLSELQIVSQLRKIIPQLLNYERVIREKILENQQEKIEKILNKAKNALIKETFLSLEELMTHLSMIRLGSILNLLPVSLQTANFLFLFSLKTNIIKSLFDKVSFKNLNKFRAHICKKILTENK